MRGYFNQIALIESKTDPERKDSFSFNRNVSPGREQESKNATNQISTG